MDDHGALQTAGDFSAGLSSALTFGLSDKLIALTGLGAYGSRCSGAYAVGNVAGIAVGFVGGSLAGLAESALAEGAEATSSALSNLRQTAEGEQFFHYGYAEQAANFEQGILPGGYGTTVEGLSGTEAQSGLALPHATPPNAVYSVSPAPGTWIQANPSAAEAFGQPGGLPEVQFLYGTGPGTVSGPFPIP